MVGVCESYCVESGVEANMILEGGSKIILQKVCFPSLLDFIKSLHDAAIQNQIWKANQFMILGLMTYFGRPKNASIHQAVSKLSQTYFSAKITCSYIFFINKLGTSCRSVDGKFLHV